MFVCSQDARKDTRWLVKWLKQQKEKWNKTWTWVKPQVIWRSHFSFSEHLGLMLSVSYSEFLRSDVSHVLGSHVLSLSRSLMEVAARRHAEEGLLHGRLPSSPMGGV